MAHDLHNKYYLWLIQYSIQAEEENNLDSVTKIVWPSPEVLQRTEIFEIAWSLPEEKHMEWDDYNPKYGDPAENGRGDMLVRGPNNEKLVKLKGERIWTKTKRIVQQAKRTRSEDDNSDGMRAMFKGQTWDAMCANIHGESSSSIVPKAGDTTWSCEEVFNEDDTGSAHGQAKIAALALTVEEKPSPPPPKAGRLPTPSPSKSPPPSKGMPLRSESSTSMTKPKKTIGKKPPNEIAATGGDKKKPGRARADPAEMLKGMLTNFQQCEDASNVKYFGQEWKNVKRNLENYLKGIASLIEEVQDDETLGNYQRLEKQGKAVRKVLDKVHRSGMRESIDIFEQTLAWLQLDPDTENPFPRFFRHTMYDQSVENACTESAFWSRLHKDVMIQCAIKPADLTEKQVDLIGDRIELIMQPPAEFAEAKCRMAELCKAYDASGVAGSGSDAKSLDEVVELMSLIAFAPEWPPFASPEDRIEMFEAAAPKCEKGTCKIGQRLLSYANGRILLDEAKKKFLKLKSDSSGMQLLGDSILLAFKVIWLLLGATRCGLKSVLMT